MTKETLLNYLHTAEKDIGVFYPLAQNDVQLQDHKDNLQKILAYEKVTKNEKITHGIMYLVIGVICFVLFNMNFMLHDFMIFFAIPAVLMGAFKFWGVMQSNREIAKIEKMLQETDVAIVNCKNYITQQCNTLAGLAIYKSMMPTECILPEYARKFVSYIETNQAASLPEARKLFDEFLYREKMASLASEQLAATKRTEAAMITAASQAASAAAAAKNAANAAYYAGQAANYTRNQ